MIYIQVIPTAHTDLTSRHFAGHIRMTRAETTVDSPCLPIHVGRFIAAQEQRHPRNLVGMASPPHRIQLSDLLLRAPLPGGFVHRRRHAGLDDARADGIDAHARAHKLVGQCLRQRHDSCLGGAVRR